MKMVGWFAVGDGKFGPRTYGETFVSLEDNIIFEDHRYWESRGYDLIEVFVKDVD